MLNVTAVLVLAVFAAENAPPPKANVSLAEELRAADLEYRGKLEDILRRAEMQDDKAVKADVEKRQAATAHYQSAGAKRLERVLTVTGNIQGPAEFVMYPDSVGLITFTDRPNPSLITLNNQPWANWLSEKLPVSVEEIVRWRVTTAPGVVGKVVGRYYPRAAGIRSIRLDPLGVNSPVPFTLHIVYKAKAAEGRAQPEKQSEPVVGK